MRLLVTRAQADAQPLVERLEGLGHEVVRAPLLEIHFHDSVTLELDGIQAILATSANGVRALARVAGKPLRPPLLAVGDATARTACELGFEAVESAGGDVQALAALVQSRLTPADGAVLHIAAGDLAGDLAGTLRAAGFEVRRATLYEARTAATLPVEAARALVEGKIDAALFFSPRTAAAFARLVRGANLVGTCRDVVACCLSPAVARELAEIHWRALRTAAEPTEAGLLGTL